MNRRTLIVGGGTLVTASLAGCFGDSDDEKRTVTISELTVGNLTQTPRTIEVRIVDDEGEEAYSRTEELPAQQGDSAGGFSVSSDELPTEPRQYHVHARLSEQDWEKVYLPDTAQGSTEVLITIEENHPRPQIWSHSGD